MFLRKRKLISRFLMSVLLIEALSPLLADKAYAGSPVSDKLSGLVDPFTGDFHYSVPLLSVPGPGGENVPLVLTYSSGIKMEQEASWVGLGWNLNPGEITRQVQGIPDDYKNDFVDNQNSSSSWIIGAYYFGALNQYRYNELPYPSSYPDYKRGTDIYQTKRIVPGNRIMEFPDYDTYYASGPGLGGQLSPHLFDYKTLVHNDMPPNDFSADLSTTTDNNFTKRPEFIFNQENAPKAFSNFASLNDWAQGYYPGNFSSFQYLGVNSNNRANAGNYVEYFTNEQLAGSSLPAGYLDYHAGVQGERANAAQFPQAGIGAFRITNTSGITYHYSLPVYGYDETSYTFALDQNREPLTNTYFTSMSRAGKYATSWKLTAITGTDYQDSNGNHIADEGDKGYWVAFDYGLWAGTYQWKMPYYGYSNDVVNAIVERPWGTNIYQETYKRLGSVNSGKNELYFLNSIKTATHTAYFFKEMRNDNIGVRDANGNATPQMGLAKVVLLRNEDTRSFSIPNSTDAIPGFGFSSSTYNKQNVIHMGNYTANQAAIESASLKTIEFGYNYSLCPKIPNNKFGIFSLSARYDAGSGVKLYDKVTSATYSTAESGRLSLYTLKSFEKGHQQVLPPYLFSYAKNVDYSLNAQDVWGYYKNDYDDAGGGMYRTSYSKEDVDTWSLSSITTPLGGVISMSYESDDYSQVGATGDGTNLGSPQRVFIAKTHYRDTIGGTHVNGYFKNAFSYYDRDAGKFLLNNYKKVDFMLGYRNAQQAYSCVVNTGCSLSDIFYQYGSFSYPPGSSPNNDFQLYTPVAGDVETRNITLLKGPCWTNCPFLDETYNPSYTIAYTSVFPQLAYGGGIRASQVRIFDPESNHTYRNIYAYSGGIATVEPDQFSTSDPVKLSRSYVATDRHTLAPMVGYSNVTVTDLGTSGSMATGKTEYVFSNYTEAFACNDVFTTNTADPVPAIAVMYVEEDHTLYGALLAKNMYDNNNNLVMSLKNEYSTKDDNLTGIVDEAFATKTNGYSQINVKREYRKVLKSVTSTQDKVVTKKEQQNTGVDPYTGMPTISKSYDYTQGLKTITSTPAYVDNSEMGSKLINPAYKNILQPLSREVITGTNAVVEKGRKELWTKDYNYRYFNGSAYATATTNNSALGSGFWFGKTTRIFNGNTSDTDWKITGQITLLDDQNKLVLEQKDIKRYSAVKYGYNRSKFKVSEAGNCNYSSFAFSSFEDTLIVSNTPLPLVYYSGEVQGGANRYAPPANTGVVPHTGSYVSLVQPGVNSAAFYSAVNDQLNGSVTEQKGLQKGRSYRASVWVHNTSSNGAQLVATLTGSLSGGGSANTTVVKQKDDPINIKAGNWTLMTVDIDVPATILNGGSISVSLNNPSSYAPISPTGGTLPSVGNALPVYFDDFNLHPVDAPVRGYVRDPRTGWVLAELDNENFATYYTYDPLGRVTGVDKETSTFNGTRKVSTNTYHNAR